MQLYKSCIMSVRLIEVPLINFINSFVKLKSFFSLFLNKKVEIWPLWPVVLGLWRVTGSSI
jgi:hypothetical protein